MYAANAAKLPGRLASKAKIATNRKEDSESMINEGGIRERTDRE